MGINEASTLESVNVFSFLSFGGVPPSTLKLFATVALHLCTAVTATIQGCQVAVGGSDITRNSRHPREAELLLKRCTSLILELLSFSPWVVKMCLWIFSALSGQGVWMNNLFSAGKKSKCLLNKQEYHFSPFLLKLWVWFFVPKVWTMSMYKAPNYGNKEVQHRQRIVGCIIQVL